jgi:hypothetical protein
MKILSNFIKFYQILSNFPNINLLILIYGYLFLLKNFIFYILNYLKQNLQKYFLIFQILLIIIYQFL